MKDDNSKPSIQKISCNNINNNNIDLGDATNDEAISSSSDVSPSFSKVDSQPDKKGDFVDPCLNNNNVKIITNNFNTGTTVNNNNLNIENNNAQEQLIVQQQEACTNAADINTDDDTGITIGEITGDTTITTSQTTTIGVNQSNNCTVTQDQSATNANQSIADNDSVVLTSSSVANVEQPLEQSQQIKSFQTINGIDIQQQGNLPIDTIRQLEFSSIKDSPIASQGIGDSHELTALEKTTKLKQQWLELLP
jgi:hypothetical protein